MTDRSRGRRPTPADPAIAVMTILGGDPTLGLGPHDHLLYDPAGPAIFSVWREVPTARALAAIARASTSDRLRVALGELPPAIEAEAQAAAGRTNRRTPSKSAGPRPAPELPPGAMGRGRRGSLELVR